MQSSSQRRLPRVPLTLYKHHHLVATATVSVTQGLHCKIASKRNETSCQKGCHYPVKLKVKNAGVQKHTVNR